jgi:hypothetical protein
MTPIDKPDQKKGHLHEKIHKEYWHALVGHLAHPVRADCIVQLKLLGLDVIIGLLTIVAGIFILLNC